MFVARGGDAARALQHPERRAATSATSSACRARRRRRFRPRRCSRIRAGLYDYRAALPALAMVLVPAVLMVSTIRFRSFKTIDLQSRRPYTRADPRRRRHHADRDASARRARRDRVHLSRVRVHRHGDHRASAIAAAAPADESPALPPTSDPRDATRSMAGAASNRTSPSYDTVARVHVRSTGSVIVTVVPTPRSLATLIVPPFSSTFRFAIVRPSPVPRGLRREVRLEDLRRAPPGSMPTPVSAHLDDDRRGRAGVTCE